MYYAIFISPHLDDAILSCGAFISSLVEAGNRILIASLATEDYKGGNYSDLALAAHKFWGFKNDPMKFRRLEDINACQTLKVDYLHLGTIDCIYRRDENKKIIYEDQSSIFRNVDHKDCVNQSKIILELLKSLPESRNIFAPAGVGGHIDHIILHELMKYWKKDRIWYYSEFPYLQEGVELKNAIERNGLHEAFIFRYSEISLKKKTKSIKCYKSQLSAVFSSFSSIDSAFQTRMGYQNNEHFYRKKDSNVDDKEFVDIS